jgi:hypothetical protein
MGGHERDETVISRKVEPRENGRGEADERFVCGENGKSAG